MYANPTSGSDLEKTLKDQGLWVDSMRLSELPNDFTYADGRELNDIDNAISQEILPHRKKLLDYKARITLPTNIETANMIRYLHKPEYFPECSACGKKCQRIIARVVPKTTVFYSAPNCEHFACKVVCISYDTCPPTIESLFQDVLDKSEKW